MRHRLPIQIRDTVRYAGLLILPIVFAAGCGGNRTPEKTTGITGIDDCGRMITLSHPARRIALLTGSPVDVLFELGVGNRIIGVTDNFAESYPATCRKYPSLAKLPKIGSRSTPDIEAIIALKPDLILVSGSGDNPEKNAGALKKAGLTYAVMKSFEGVETGFDRIGHLAVLFGKPERGKEIVALLRKRIAAQKSFVTMCTKGIPKINYWWGSGNGTYGASTALDELVAIAGGENISAAAGKGFFQLSPEYVVVSDPEVSVFSYWRKHDRESRAESYRKRPGFERIRAVRDNRVHAIDGHIFHSAILFPAAIDSFIGWFHPQSYGRNSEVDGSSKNSNTRTVTDDRGRNVIIPVGPKRIVTVATGDVEILYAIGAQKALAGVPDNAGFPPEAQRLEKIGGMYGRFNAERIVGQKPDLVLMTMSGWEQYARHCEQLAENGLSVLGLNYPSTFDELLIHIRKLGFLCGCSAAADSLVRVVAERKKVIVDHTSALSGKERPRVYLEWISNSGRGTTCGWNDRDHQLITMAGGTNIFGNSGLSSIIANDEEVIARDPQIIVISADTTRFTPDRIAADVRKRNGWHRISAVRDGKIFVIDAKLTWANPRMITGLELLARIIHPEFYP